MDPFPLSDEEDEWEDQEWAEEDEELGLVEGEHFGDDWDGHDEPMDDDDEGDFDEDASDMEEEEAARGVDYEPAMSAKDREQGPIVRYSRARTESGVSGDVNFLEHGTASYPVPSGTCHYQTADSLCLLPRPEEDAAAAAAAAPGCEEVVIGGPLQPGSGRWQLGVYQVSDSQVIRLASVCTPFNHYSMAASPCGHFIAVAGDRGLLAIFRVVRGRYDAAAIAQQVSIAAEYRQRQQQLDKLLSLLNKLIRQEGVPEASPEERAAAEQEISDMQNAARAQGMEAVRVFHTLQMMAAERWEQDSQAQHAAAKAAAAGQEAGGGAAQPASAPTEQAGTPATAAAAAAAAAGFQPSQQQQAHYEERELFAADLEGPWEDEAAGARAVDAGWRLEHVATCALAATSTQSMVNCVRWGSFGGKTRLMAACQDGHLYLLNVPTISSSSSSNAAGSTSISLSVSVPPGLKQAARALAVTDLPTWQGPYDRAKALLARAGEVELPDELMERLKHDMAATRQAVDVSLDGLLEGGLLDLAPLNMVFPAALESVPQAWAAVQQHVTAAVRGSHSEQEVTDLMPYLLLVVLQRKGVVGTDGQRPGEWRWLLQRVWVHLQLLQRLTQHRPWCSTPVEASAQQQGAAGSTAAQQQEQQAGAGSRGDARCMDVLKLITVDMMLDRFDQFPMVERTAAFNHYLATHYLPLLTAFDFGTPLEQGHITRVVVARYGPQLEDPGAPLRREEVREGVSLQTCSLSGFCKGVGLNIAQPSPDGNWVAVGADGIVLWVVPSGPDYTTHMPLLLDPNVDLAPEYSDAIARGAMGFQYCAWNSSSSLLAASSDALKFVGVWSIPDGQLLFSFTANDYQALPLSFLPAWPGRLTPQQQRTLFRYTPRRHQQQQQQQQQQHQAGQESSSKHHRYQPLHQAGTSGQSPAAASTSRQGPAAGSYLHRLMQQVRLLDDAEGGAEGSQSAGAGAQGQASQASNPAASQQKQQQPQQQKNAGSKQHSKRSKGSGSDTSEQSKSLPAAGGAGRMLGGDLETSSAGPSGSSSSSSSSKSAHEGCVVGPLPADMEQPAELLAWGTQGCAVNIAEMRCLSSRQPRPYLAPYYCIRQTLDWPPVLPAGTQLKAVRLHGLIVTPAGRLLVTSGTANDITQEPRLGVVRLLAGFSPSSFAAYPALFQQAARQLLRLAHAPSPATAAAGDSGSRAAASGTCSTPGQAAAAAAAATGVGDAVDARSYLQQLPGNALDLILQQAAYPLGCWAQDSAVGPLQPEA